MLDLGDPAEARRLVGDVRLPSDPA